MLYRLILSFIIGTFPLLAKTTIDTYACYGNAKQMVIEGRVFEESYTKEVSPSDSKGVNFWHRLKQIDRETEGADEVTVIAVVDHKKYTVKSDDWGYFTFNLHFKKRFVPGYHRVKLYVDRHKKWTTCRTVVLADTKNTGVISDFDDTLVVSDVTSFSKLFSHTFFKNYKQRTVIPGMAKKFRRILVRNNPSRFFVLTSSPKPFVAEINHFLNKHHFPKRVVLAKTILPRGGDPVFDSYRYKIGEIEHLIKLYPRMHWVLFGDNGEQDPEVYRDIRKKYPAKIKAIYIRDVKSGKLLRI